MQSRSKKSATTEGPKNAIEAGLIPAPTPSPPTGFRSLSAMPKGWKKASDALDYVRALSTIFPDFDRATRVGGVPLRRITTVHGPTHEGKTAFIAGLLRSFIDANHMAAYVDAEHATDLSFFDTLFGRPTASLPNFLGQRPTTYEETVDSADEFLNWMVAERKARQGKYGKAPVPEHENLAGILVVDSLNKLQPEKEMERIRKEGGEALDKGFGRQRANMNQAWLDHIVPRLGPAETALVLIVQERDAEELKPWERPTLKGGRASSFDASLIARVTKGQMVSRGEKAERVVYGFRHNVRIWKSKVGQMDSDHSDAFFHMSNGQLVAPGFDTARDVLCVAKDLDIVKSALDEKGKKGSWMTWRKKRWNGDHNAVVALEKDPASMHALLAEVQKAIAPEPVQ
jgi:recombination protein RecA